MDLPPEQSDVLEPAERDRLDALDRWARANPKRYRRRVIAFAALGYGYLLGIMGLALWAIVAILVDGRFLQRHVLGLVLLGLVLWGMVSALRIRLGPVEGIPLKRSDAPDLFAAINAARSQLGRPRLDRVVLDSTLNAGVSSRPRLGFLGWSEQTLHVGLIQLAAETRRSFDATLAHELQHIRGGDNALGRHIYRLRQLWSALASGQALGGRFLSYLYLPFFRWFAPRFATFTLTLSRNQELAADRASAEVAGAMTARHSLLYVTLAQGRLRREFWPAIERTTATEAQLPPMVFERLVSALHRPYPDADARRYIDEALAWPTLTSATHPALAERLIALGQAPLPAVVSVPPSPDTSAVTLLSSETLANAIETFSEQWATQTSRVAHWRREHAQRAAGLSQLADYDNVRTRGNLREDEQHDFERLAFLYRDDDTLLERIVGVGARDDDSEGSGADPALRLLVATRLAERDDPRAASLLSVIADAHPPHRSDALYALQSFQGRAGDLLKARATALRLKRWIDAREGADKERAKIGPGERFLPHELAPLFLGQLATRLQTHAVIAQAWVVRRNLRYLPELPVFLIGIRTRFDGRVVSSATRREAVRAIRASLLDGLRFPGETVLVVVDDLDIALRGRLELTPQSEIYRSASAPE